MHWTALSVPFEWTGWDLPFFGSDTDAGDLQACRDFFRMLRKRAHHHPCPLYAKLQRLAAQEAKCIEDGEGIAALKSLCELVQFSMGGRKGSGVESQEERQCRLQREDKEVAKRCKRILWSRTRSILKLQRQLLDTLNATELGIECEKVRKRLERKEKAGVCILQEMRKQAGGPKDSPAFRKAMVAKVHESEQAAVLIKRKLVEEEARLSGSVEYARYKKACDIINLLDHKFSLRKLYAPIQQAFMSAGTNMEMSGSQFEKRACTVHLPVLLQRLLDISGGCEMKEGLVCRLRRAAAELRAVAGPVEVSDVVRSSATEGCYDDMVFKNRKWRTLALDAIRDDRGEELRLVLEAGEDDYTHAPPRPWEKVYKEGTIAVKARMAEGWSQEAAARTAALLMVSLKNRQLQGEPGDTILDIVRRNRRLGCMQAMGINDPKWRTVALDAIRDDEGKLLRQVMFGIDGRVNAGWADPPFYPPRMQEVVYADGTIAVKARMAAGMPKAEASAPALLMVSLKNRQLQGEPGDTILDIVRRNRRLGCMQAMGIIWGTHDDESSDTTTKLSSKVCPLNSVCGPREIPAPNDMRSKECLMQRVKKQMYLCLRSAQDRHLLLWWYRQCQLRGQESAQGRGLGQAQEKPEMKQQRNFRCDYSFLDHLTGTHPPGSLKDSLKRWNSVEWTVAEHVSSWNSFCRMQSVPNLQLELNASIWMKDTRQDRVVCVGECDAILYDAATMQVLLWVEQKAHSSDLGKADRQRREFHKWLTKHEGWVGSKRTKKFTKHSLALFHSREEQGRHPGGRGGGEVRCWDGRPHPRCVIMTQCAAMPLGGTSSAALPKIALPGPVRHMVLLLLWAVDLDDDEQLRDAAESLSLSAHRLHVAPASTQGIAMTPSEGDLSSEGSHLCMQQIVTSHQREGSAGSILIFPPMTY